MVIYKRINTITGKVYIGKTKEDIAHGGWDRRWWDTVWEAYHGGRSIFCKAIRSYRKEAFKTEILYEAKTEHELNRMETFFIILHQSHLRENGYNQRLGGDGGGSYWLGKSFPPEMRKAISDGLRGRRHTLESRLKMSLSRKGKKIPNAPKYHLKQRRAPKYRVCWSCFRPYILGENYDQVTCSRKCATRVSYWGPDPE